MKYKVKICVINPVNCKAYREEVNLTTSIKSPTYEDMVVEYFRQWDKEDKYRNMYAIGVEKMELIE